MRLDPRRRTRNLHDRRGQRGYRRLTRRHRQGLTGELITETVEHDDGPEVTVYVPPEPPEAVVFAGDGRLISLWGSVLEAADVPSTLIVGAHRLADEMLRLHEYSLGF